jgi:hypothetical protein
MSKKDKQEKSLEALLNDGVEEQATTVDLSQESAVKERKPYPGSADAVKAGCTCPIFDNKKGQGAFINTNTNEPMFWVNDRCPMHAATQG